MHAGLVVESEHQRLQTDVWACGCYAHGAKKKLAEENLLRTCVLVLLQSETAHCVMCEDSISPLGSPKPRSGMRRRSQSNVLDSGGRERIPGSANDGLSLKTKRTPAYTKWSSIVLA
eukprot:3969772-Amphidinium_carterae.1